MLFSTCFHRLPVITKTVTACNRKLLSLALSKDVMIDSPRRQWPRGSGAVFAPTFPLDAEEKRARVVARKLAHPGSWLPVIGLFGAGLALPLASPIIGLAGAVVGSVFWLRWWWQKIDARVHRSIELEMIAESNREQDERLRARMRYYRVGGTPHLASVVARFLTAKRDFEARLACGDSHFSTHEKMECLVDGLCIGICDELDGIAVLDRQLVESLLANDESVLNEVEETRRKHLKAVRDAYVTLADAVKALKSTRSKSNTSDLNASDRRQTPEGPHQAVDLRNVIDGLREESAISRNVRARLESAVSECLN